MQRIILTVCFTIFFAGVARAQGEDAPTPTEGADAAGAPGPNRAPEPENSLAACRDGSISLHFPTIRTLEALAPHGTVDGLLEWAAERAREGVPCIFPEIEKRHGEARVIVAGRDSGALE